VRRLAAEPVEVRATSSATADLADERQLPKLVEQVDCVIHAAGIAHVFRLDAAARERMKKINVEATGALAQAAAKAGVKRFVLLSSVSVYGSPGSPMVDETSPCHPRGPYAESKYHGEQLVTKAAGKMELVILRPATVYGEGDRGNVMRLIRAIDRNRFIWIGKGGNSKSLIHRDDVAEACVLAAGTALPTGIYNVSGAPETMGTIVETIAIALGKRPPRLTIPALPVRLAISVIPLTDLQYNVKKWLADDSYDARNFRQVFGFSTSVSLQTGIQRQIAWYRSGSG
jgi:nucleoside-diphosphate-sugar epimerase